MGAGAARGEPATEGMSFGALLSAFDAARAEMVRGALVFVKNFKGRRECRVWELEARGLEG